MRLAGREPLLLAAAALLLSACSKPTPAPAKDSSSAPARKPVAAKKIAPKRADPSSDARKVFLVYRKAIRTGDFQALKCCLTSDRVAQVNSVPRSVVLRFIKVMTHDPAEITKVSVAGDAATVSLKSEEAGEPIKGSVTMHREKGQWKVAYEQWEQTGWEIQAAEAPGAGLQKITTGAH